MWVVTTMTNKGYIPYLANLVESLKRIELSWNLVVFCLDQETTDFCRENSIEHINYFFNVQKEFARFNENSFTDIAFKKFDCIRDYLENNKDITNLVYIDGDIVVFRDFLPYLKQFDFDLLFQCDESTLQCTDNCRNMCSGFMVIKNTLNVRYFLNYQKHVKDIHIFDKVGADQAYVNSLLPNFGRFRFGIKKNTLLRYATLPKHLFPNGVHIDELPTTAFLLHYNYTIGHDKQKRMKEHGHWFLTE